MRINADFSQRVAVHFDDIPWVQSPAAGVERKMLDRIGEEVARATTIVRFAPGSSFSAHTHDGGEEYLVLDGVFQDQTGDFPVGSYVRNPPTSRHAPAAADGAMILVKLHQFDPEDRQTVHVDTTEAQDPHLPLYSDPHEDVCLVNWAPGLEVSFTAEGGAELFVLEGGYQDGDETFGRWDWLRLPPGGQLDAKAGPDGARVWIKSGHLTEMVKN